VALSMEVTALLTWSMPEACSVDAEAISATISATRRTEVRISSRVLPAPLTNSAPFLTHSLAGLTFYGLRTGKKPAAAPLSHRHSVGVRFFLLPKICDCEPVNTWLFHQRFSTGLCTQSKAF